MNGQTGMLCSAKLLIRPALFYAPDTPRAMGRKGIAIPLVRHECSTALKMNRK